MEASLGWGWGMTVDATRVGMAMHTLARWGVLDRSDAKRRELAMRLLEGGVAVEDDWLRKLESVARQQPEARNPAGLMAHWLESGTWRERLKDQPTEDRAPGDRAYEFRADWAERREQQMREDAIAQAEQGVALDWIDTAMEWGRGTAAKLVHDHARAEHDCSGEELLERWRKDRRERGRRLRDATNTTPPERRPEREPVRPPVGPARKARRLAQIVANDALPDVLQALCGDCGHGSAFQRGHAPPWLCSGCGIMQKGFKGLPKVTGGA